MPSDHECCEHSHGHTSRHELKKDEVGKAKTKTTSPKTTSSAAKKKGRSKKKEELSADALLAKIAELEAGKVETVPLVPIAPSVSSKVGLHIPADLREKYLTQVASTAREKAQIQTYQARIAAVQKEREEILAEIARVEEKKQTLDNLCKQLQARNKEILDGVRVRGEEEQQKRKELSERFSVTINEITARMEQQQQERLKMAAENDGLRQQIEAMKDSILGREEAFKALHDKKDLEVAQLQDRLKDCEAKAAAEEKKFQQWRDAMEGQGLVVEDLRNQLQVYSSKFELFQSTLAKSNPVFLTYKLEMDKISKRIRTLEQENHQLRLKTARADLQIVDMAEQRAKNILKAERLEAENEQLQALAKDLNAERARLKALKSGIQPSSEAPPGS